VKWQNGPATLKTLAFLRWWSGELNMACRDAVARLAPRWQRTMTLYLDPRGATLIDDATGHRSELLCDVEGWGGLADEAPEAFTSELERFRRIRLVVDGKLAYCRTFRLPSAAAPYLASAINIQLPKLLPLDAASLLVDFEVNPSPPSEAFLTVRVAALRHTDIDPVVERLKKWGFQIVSTHTSDSPTAERRFKFGDHGGYRYRWGLRRVDKCLVGIAAMLAVACASLTVAEGYRSQKALSLAVESTESTARAALQNREALSSKLDPLATLARLEALPQAAEILWEITRSVPLNTFVTTFELKEHAVRMTGVTPDSAQVIKLLSSASSLSDIELKSSMSLGIGTGLDRFEIMAHTKEAVR
jgi:hypothetical protein